jgi:CheY-like chemotaxis protein
MTTHEPAVLILEPSRLLQQAAARACLQRSVRAYAVTEIGRALSFVAKSKPIAILTARELPGLGGESLIAALKSSMYHRAIPIGLMTSDDVPAERGAVYRPDTIIRKTRDLTAAVLGFLIEYNVGRDPQQRGGDLPPSLLHARILLAEDSETMHRLISRHLHVAGAEVVVVENGADAVDVASRQNFDLILMDIEMPEMNGLDATRNLRGSGLEVPIVACTGDATEDLRRRASEAGFDDVIAKQAGAAAVVAKCAELLDRTACAKEST